MDILLSPASILRSDRQRSKLQVEDLKDSIQRLGVLHPVVVRQVGEDVVLVAGERRLQACLELGIEVPVRFFNTLTPIEAAIVELEENLKRSDLGWQDQCRAMAKIHQLHTTLDSTWDQTKTATSIGVSGAHLSRFLTVAERLGEEAITSQPGMDAAYNLIARQNSRIADIAMTQLMEEVSPVEAFGAIFAEPVTTIPAPTPPPQFLPPIIQGDFREWAPSYAGPKFNLLHCDFPYGIGVFRPGGHIGMGGTAQVEYSDTEEVYFELIQCLLSNMDRFLSHSAHVLFWFSMQHYEKTRLLLSKRLTVFPLPLVWVKSDNAGVAPDPQRGPRQIYETALLAYRGDRNIVRIVSNAYSGPTDKSLHPSTKPEPMLRHFLTMLCDGTTRLLDPTAGSGSAIRAAESLGAEYTFGIESNPEHVTNANDAVRKARILRKLSKEATLGAQHGHPQ